MKRRVAVLIDGAHVPRFARLAIDAIMDCDEVTVFSCTNTVIKRNARKFAAYYALNLAAIRNPLTEPVPLSESTKRITQTVSFASGYEGNWQTLPDDVIDALREFDLVLKFGLSLMRVPPPERLATPILSYHHGDPDHYRGRPAGFWEMLHGAPAMGQIVQIISNKLDAGKVVAFGETKVLPHSYRATLMSAYAHSPLLINAAIANALAGRSLPKPCQGKNYRLPSNLTVVKFVLQMMLRAMSRMLYGLVMEKEWRVSTAAISPEVLDGIIATGVFPEQSGWVTVPESKDHSFYADPFFSADPPGILVEAMNRRTGLGEIVLVADGSAATLSAVPGHLSYPFTFPAAGRQLIIPEAASWSDLRSYVIEDGAMRQADVLRVQSGVRVLDPTLLEHGGRLYLFGNDHRLSSTALFIWCAASLDDEFVPHPMSPALVSPRGGRMGGAFLHTGGRLVRLGQSFLGDYGDGLFAYEVEELSPTNYRERLLGTVKFHRVKGPHTMNVRDGEIVFDWYRQRFSLFAAPRRLRAKLRERALTRSAA